MTNTVPGTSRILIITYAYFPDRNARAFRWTALSEYFVKNGKQVDIVCLGTGARPEYENINGVSVYRVKDISEKIKLMVRKKKESRSKENRVIGDNQKYRFSKYANELLAFFRWPDYAFLWIIPAIRRSNKLIRNNSYEALISVAHPFSSHVVAFFAKKKNIGHKWICDYGDPFSVDEITPSNNFTLYRSLNRWIEKKIIFSSKNISVTTQRTIDLYVNGLSVPQEMFTVINPLFSFNEKNDYSDSVSDTIQFIFSGTLYKKIRNPSFLIQLISKLRQALPKKNIELHFYGKLNDCYDEFEPYMSAMNKWLFIHGEVERAALYMSYSASSVLVNIGNATNFQVPSKIIEYMSTGLPILNIYSSSVDTSYSFLERYPAKLSVSANLPDINESIQQLVNFLEKVYIVEHSLLQDIMAEYQIDTVSGKYLQMMA